MKLLFSPISTKLLRANEIDLTHDYEVVYVRNSLLHDSTKPLLLYHMARRFVVGGCRGRQTYQAWWWWMLGVSSYLVDLLLLDTCTVDSQSLVVWICRAKSAPNFGRRESLFYISSAP